MEPIEPLESKERMEAEPAVYYNGEVSDESEHLDWLDSPEGNRLADARAIEHARASGMTEEDITLLYGDQGAKVDLEKP
jgi:hypothetical protein